MRDTYLGMPKFILLPLALLAQQNPESPTSIELITDRPDFTESAVAVPQGDIQLELGSAWERSGDADAVNGAEALVRWGALAGLELRFALPDYVSSAGLDGLTDAALGVKLPLGRPLGWELAVIGDVSIPTGDDTFGGTGTEGNVILTTGGDLGGSWSLGTQISGAWSSDPGDLQLGYTAVLGLSIDDRLGTFAEVAVDPLEEGPRSVLLHHGYAYLVRPTLQLDLHLGVGVSDSAPDALVGLGLSTRWGG